jgi:serine/threonine protein kinase
MLNPNIDSNMKKIVRKMMELEPKNRPTLDEIANLKLKSDCFVMI